MTVPIRWFSHFLEVNKLAFPQQITKFVNALSEEQAKQLLIEVLIAKNYSNQEVLMKVQGITEQIEQSE